MNESEQEVIIRRILVALDASTHSLAALEAAADLAASLGAELSGLFVEDENLIHLAGLPFSHEVGASSATQRPMSTDKMERQMRLQAAQARQALETAARRVKVRHSFRTIRGQVTAAVLNAALEADLLAMGRVGRPLSSRSRLGSTARAASADTAGSVLLVQQGGALSYPVMVTYDGSPPSLKALGAAIKLAQASGDDLSILLLGDTEEASAALKEKAGLQIGDRGLRVKFQWLPQASVTKLAEMVQAAEDCVLVLGGDNLLLEPEAIQKLLDETDCPVMLVR